MQGNDKVARSELPQESGSVLVRELERVAADILALNFAAAVPPGTRELMVRFWVLSEELDRRGLPASVAVEQCRFMFPPL